MKRKEEKRREEKRREEKRRPVACKLKWSRNRFSMLNFVQMRYM